MRARTMILALLVACSAPEELEATCDTSPDPEACSAGCLEATESVAYEWGRLACIHGDAPLSPATFEVADQDEGPAFQEGYEACFFEEVERGWLAEGCG